ncbi:MAG: gephyrin-like molybdotransferase Glp [Syntrophobacteraceae bacterium]
MSEFLKVRTAGEVLAILEDIRPLPSETVPLERAGGRVAASDIQAPEPVPHFVRATMDGFAVRARDTFGASESLPAMLDTAGEVLMGDAATTTLPPGRAIAVPTGGMLPEGADAVVMVEYTQALDAGTIEVTRPVAPGENVLGIGDDIREGETIFVRGRRLLPQDIGVLAALGLTEIAVFRRPRVALISTGDEIVPVETRAVPSGKVRDVNTFSLAAQIESAGVEVGMREKVPDKLEDLVAACLDALSGHDMIVLSGGSSVGARDYTVRVLERLPDSVLLVHGVAIRPGKPTILGLSGEKIFWGLPGQPVSALITCRAFVVPSLERLQGRVQTGAAGRGATSLRAILNRRLPSVHGRTDFVPVSLSGGDDGVVEAAPIFGKSGAISILARAEGYVIVPEHVEGFDRGTEVVVYPFAY